MMVACGGISQLCSTHSTGDQRVSFVPGRCFLERLPLLTIMTKDDQFHMLALDQIQEFTRAASQLLLVLKRPGFSIRRKKALQDNRIDGQQDRSNLWQVYQH